MSSPSEEFMSASNTSANEVEDGGLHGQNDDVNGNGLDANDDGPDCVSTAVQADDDGNSD